MVLTFADLGALALAFLAGSLPTAYLAVRRATGGDIRGLGSGNVGATNAGRVLGRRGFAVVFAVDALKGALPVALGAWLAAPAVGLSGPATALDAATLSLRPAWLGAAAVAGHCWTPWLRFQGGKGVATAVGALAVFAPAAAALGFALWAVIARMLKVSSLGSLAGLVGAAIVVLGYGHSADRWPFAAIATIVVWRHRGNLQRLARGDERRMGAAS